MTYICLNIELTLKNFKYILVLAVTLLTLSAFAGDGSIERRYFKNGNVKFELERLPGQMVKITSYYKNGQVKEIGHYKKGKRHGMFQDFHDDGRRKTTAFFLGDKKDGLWTYYHLSGQIERYVIFNCNKVLRYEEYQVVENNEFY